MKVLNLRRRSFNSQIMTFEWSRARASSRGHISAIAKVSLALSHVPLIHKPLAFLWT